MKKRNVLALALLLFLCSPIKVFTQPAVPCSLVFGDGLACGQTVDISWTFYNLSMSACSSGNATVSTTQLITCGVGCASLYDLRITVTAVDGCSINPVTVSWYNAGQAGGKDVKPIPVCPCSPSPPPGSTCCDSGTSVFMDIGGSKAYVN